MDNVEKLRRFCESHATNGDVPSNIQAASSQEALFAKPQPPLTHAGESQHALALESTNKQNSGLGSQLVSAQEKAYQSVSSMCSLDATSQPTFELADSKRLCTRIKQGKNPELVLQPPPTKNPWKSNAAAVEHHHSVVSSVPLSHNSSADLPLTTATQLDIVNAVHTETKPHILELKHDVKTEPRPLNVKEQSDAPESLQEQSVDEKLQQALTPIHRPDVPQLDDMSGSLPRPIFAAMWNQIPFVAAQQKADMVAAQQLSATAVFQARSAQELASFNAPVAVQFHPQLVPPISSAHELGQPFGSLAQNCALEGSSAKSSKQKKQNQKDRKAMRQAEANDDDQERSENDVTKYRVKEGVSNDQMQAALAAILGGANPGTAVIFKIHFHTFIHLGINSFIHLDIHSGIHSFRYSFI